MILQPFPAVNAMHDHVTLHINGVYDIAKYIKIFEAGTMLQMISRPSI